MTTVIKTVRKNFKEDSLLLRYLIATFQSLERYFDFSKIFNFCAK